MNPKDFQDVVYDIIGAAMTVHRELNWGLLEPVYNEAMHMELQEMNIRHSREEHLHAIIRNGKWKNTIKWTWWWMMS